MRESTYWTKDLKKKVSIISISLITGLFLMGIKFYTYRLTGSYAILSDALESIINVVASAFALGSVLFSAIPPDEDHPYGHGKIEYFSAGFEGALIIVAAIGIFITGFSRLLSPSELPNLSTGLFLLLGSTAVNFILSITLIQVGRKTNSLALVADGKHIFTDVLTSIGVISGLFFVFLTQWLWLDGCIAILVGGHILFTGVKLVLEAFGGLMDRSDPELLEDITRLIEKHRRKCWINIHKLRAIRSGAFFHVDFHLVLPRYFSLAKSHREVRRAENIFKDYYKGNVSVLIHVDPCENSECRICRQIKCTKRCYKMSANPYWNREALTLKKKPTLEELNHRENIRREGA